MLSQVISGETVTIEEVMQMADETQQLLEYSQRLEQTTKELQSTTSQLRQANQQLRRLDQQKDEFLSQVSHEVRTPMTAIRSFAEILLTHKNLEQGQRRRFVNTIHDESKRLTSLLDEILDLSALERGETLWTNEPTDIEAAIKRAIEVCTPITRQHHMRVSRGRNVRGVRVDANADRLCQVFINLVSNAAKYNNAKNPTVEITSRVENSKLVVDFCDNGPGIAPRYRKRIFAKFSRGKRAADTNEAGSGLGLAISREILAKMNGTLELVHGKKNGARFRVILPLSKSGG